MSRYEANELSADMDVKLSALVSDNLKGSRRATKHGSLCREGAKMLMIYRES